MTVAVTLVADTLATMPTPAPRWYLHGAACPECGEAHTYCADHNADGDPCRGRCVTNSWKCATHGGRALRDLAPIEGRDLDEMVKTYQSVGPLLDAAHVKTAGMDFAESVQDALNRANAMVQTLYVLLRTLAPRAKFSTYWLGEDGPRPQLVVDVQTEGLIGPDDKANLQAHPWMTLYKEWVTIQGQLATKASDLGLVEHQIRVQEAQTEVLAMTLMAILTDLGIDPQSPEALPVIERRLLAMDSTVIELGRPALTATATGS
jgi:hypothetical protein